MQGKCRVARPTVGSEAVGDRADVQEISQTRGDYLEQLAMERVWPSVMQLGKTAAGAGQPSQEGSGGEKDLEGSHYKIH